MDDERRLRVERSGVVQADARQAALSGASPWHEGPVERRRALQLQRQSKDSGLGGQGLLRGRAAEVDRGQELVRSIAALLSGDQECVIWALRRGARSSLFCEGL